MSESYSRRFSPREFSSVSEYYSWAYNEIMIIPKIILRAKVLRGGKVFFEANVLLGASSPRE